MTVLHHWSEKNSDDINWFGVKVGLEKSAAGSGDRGVGRYLNFTSASSGAKRLLSSPATTEIPEVFKKKRKTGFGSFEGW